MSPRDPSAVRKSHAVALAIAAAVAAFGCGGGDKASRDPAPKLESNAQPLVSLSRSGWTATASVTGAGTVAANVLDNNAATRWTTGTAQAAGQYLQVDMTKKWAFVGLTMDTSQTPGEYPAAFRVNVSNDGVNWGNAVATGMGSGAVVNVYFPSQYARFVRVTLTAPAAANWSIHDFKVLSSSLPRTGWIATATSTEGSNVASGAIDDAGGTFWTSASAQTGQSFTVDMQGRRAFDQIILDSGSGRSNDYPRSYSVFVSNDGATWGSMVVGGNATASPVIINFPGQFARFIKITAGTDPNSWTIGELRVNGQPTAQTKLPRTGWTATATSSSGSNAPAGALDGLTSSSWTSNGAQTGQSFTLDMLTLRTFNQLTLDAGTTSSNYPRAYSVSVSSDGTTFSPSVASGAGSAGLTTINLPTQTARYIRISQTATDSTPWSIQELNVLGPTVARQGWLVTGSSAAGSDVPMNAIDGNAATRWTSGEPQTAMGPSIKVDLGVIQTFNQVTLEAGSATNAPQGYSIQVSTDDASWSPPVASGAGNVTVTANFPTQTARYIKVTQTGSSTNPWSIQELNVARVVQPCDTAVCTASGCHGGLCDPASGACSTMAQPDGTPCVDADRCTNGDACMGGVCQPVPDTSCTPGSNVIFYQSYDHPGTAADIAAGDAIGDPSHPFVQVTGLFGLGSDSSAYPWVGAYGTQGTHVSDIALGKPGSVSFWVKPRADFSPPTLFMAYDSTANINFYVFGSPTKIIADFVPAGDYSRIAHLEYGWTPTEAWHLVVVNWGVGIATISVDGAPAFGYPVTTLGGPRPGPQGFGNALFAMAGETGYSKDELLVLNRPMTNEEISWYYNSAKAGGAAGANPAIARFVGTTTACNLGEDLNPCTADACDAATGTITHSNVPDGTPCSDGNMCNGAETCQSGLCTQSSPALACSDACHQPGTCDPLAGCTLGAPIDKVGCNITLNPVNVVDMGDGTFKAVFGYISEAATPFHPTTNTVSLDGVVQPGYQPPPPAYLTPGDHPDAYLPTFANGQTITWTLDGQWRTASASSTRLTPTLFGTNGQRVTIGGVDIIVKPDTGSYPGPPAPPPLPSALPMTGGPFNGTIPATLGVSPTGAAVYSVPIAIPPGIAGMAPNLALIYNSQAPNGIAGQGWDLQGLSAIQRCARTRAQDGAASPVQMGALAGPGASEDNPGSTSVCLDGKRLFFRESNSSGFIYESETQDRVVLDGVTFGGTFSMTTRTGETRYYGYKPDSRVRFPGDPGFEGDGYVTAVWALDRVVDKWGNYYELEYNDGLQDFEQRGLLVTKISYTGHLATGSLVQGDYIGETPPFNAITFTYDPPVNDPGTRIDVRNIRFGKYLLPKNRRLQSIDVGSGIYSLTYAGDDIMLPSRLNAISYCVGGGTTNCLEPLQFDWEAGGYGWTEAAAYKLPASIAMPLNSELVRVQSGSQMVDLDGDGRLDFVLSKVGAPTQVWRNTGHDFTPAPSGWVLPDEVALVNSDGTSTGGAFADFDGDGLVDFIFAPGGSDPSCSGWIQKFCKVGDYTPVRIWLNRLMDPSQRKWVETAVLENLPTSWRVPVTISILPFVDLVKRDVAVDINGDGRADIVRMREPTDASQPLRVLLNAGVNMGWNDASASYTHVTGDGYRLLDVNRDGLLDLVPRVKQGTTAFIAALNKGSATGNAWTDIVESNAYVNYFNYLDGTAVQTGDFDGDGLMDSVLRTHRPDGRGGLYFDIGLSFSTGIGHDTGIATWDLNPDGTKTELPGTTGGALSRAYQTTLAEMLRPVHFMENFTPPQVALMDLNGDGLADIIEEHKEDGGRGQVMLNMGDALRDLDGATTWRTSAGSKPVPIFPVAFGTAAFIDLDGDGMTDVANNTTAWLSTFRQAVIKKFPAGVAPRSIVNYEVITTEAARTNATYSDGAQVVPGTTRLVPPLKVVANIAAADGIGGTATTTYQYSSMRASTSGRGAQGFETVAAIDPSGNTTVTTYAQAFPYTGAPVKVTHLVPGPVVGLVQTAGVASTTVNTYCDAPVTNATETPVCTPPTGPSTPFAPRTTRRTYPLQTVDTTNVLVASGPYLVESGKAQVTTTEFRYDSRGNALRTTVSVVGAGGDRYKTETVNVYETPAASSQSDGRITDTTTVTQRLDDGSPGITHHTTFDYADVLTVLTPFAERTRAMVKKRIEPGAGLGIELHTAFKYDRYGNVITTTDCATDFAGCEAGAPGPNATDDGTHLPYRTASVSYRPADFNAPSGLPIAALSYGDGRFPVRTTNAAGLAEYTAYDPKFGVLVQKTAIDGIHTCRQLDLFGRETVLTDRCGSSEPLVTTIDRRRSNPAVDPSYVATVTLTKPPTGLGTWTYGDILGRKVRTIDYGFAGTLTTTATEYDHRGYVYRASKPYASGNPAYWKTMTYDQIGRVTGVVEDLAPIDGSSTPAFGSVGTTYLSDKTTITHNVHGETRVRSETRNGLGKLASATDGVAPDVGTINYYYDADGNLRKTLDPLGNSVEIQYDVRGRKRQVDDPDLGQWKYTYDSFGDLLTQSDAKLQVTRFTYDQLGRMISKTDSAGTSRWLYNAADVANPGAIGKLAGMVSSADTNLTGTCATPYSALPTDGSRAARWFTYDGLGQMTDSYDCADGETLQTSFAYDRGRQKTVQYPAIHGSRLVAEYHYTSAGYLQYVSSAADGKVLWVANAVNAAGQTTDETTGNGVETVSDRNPATGWLMGSTTVAHATGDTVLQAWLYRYDEAGNLRGRKRYDSIDGDPQIETFEYDPLDRVLSSELTIASPTYHSLEKYTYDLIGNIKSKAGVDFTYGTCGAGPHAVCQVGTRPAFTYDPNGSMTIGADRTLGYSPGNRVTHIDSHPAASQGNDRGVIDFAYDADGNRVVQVATNTASGETTRTRYLGLGATGRSLYERTKRGNTTEHTQFIYAGSVHGGNAFALRMQTDDASGNGGPVSLRFNHFDHLGSVTAISDDAGRVVSGAAGGPDATTMGYDAWGARRNPDGTAANPASFSLPPGHRGFTGHETIPNVGLVNMNGRVYDPVIGRFLSADPRIQFLGDLQSFNRYSYVHNNPLSYTDPTGYDISDSIFAWTFKVAETALIVVACVYGGEAVCIGFAVVAAVGNASVAIADGAPVLPTIGVAALSVAFSYVGGAVGGGVASGLGDEVGAQIVGGAVSGAVTAALTDVTLRRGNLGEDMLAGAAMGAFSAGLTWSAKQINPVSQADVAQGGGAEKGGSGFVRAPSGASSADIAEIEGYIDTARDYEALGLRIEGAEYRQLAINKAIDVYGIETGLTTDIVYDPDLPGEGRFEKGLVRIGPEAFRNAGYLGSTIAHEAEVHGYQYFTGNLAMSGTAGRALNEAEAYSYEVINAKRFGLNAYDLHSIQSRALANEWRATIGGYAGAISSGSYTVRPGDLYAPNFYGW